MDHETPPRFARPDIAGRGDLECLVNAFYAQVRRDELIGFIFTDVAGVDWGTHLPKLYAFWETVLFGGGGYTGNLLGAHARLVPLTTMGPAQFERWISLFNRTVDELFAGPKATHLKAIAGDMANVIHARINGVAQAPFDYGTMERGAE